MWAVGMRSTAALPLHGSASASDVAALEVCARTVYAAERVELRTPPVSLSVQLLTPEESTPAAPEPVPDFFQADPVEALLQELQAAALKVSSVRPYRN